MRGCAANKFGRKDGDMAKKPTTPRARSLRQTMTRAEIALWKRVRNRQLGGFKIRRQHAIDGYYADFASEAVKLVIELDGEAHIGSEAYDALRTETIEAAGWRVVRFTNMEVLRTPEPTLKKTLEELQLGRA